MSKILKIQLLISVFAFLCIHAAFAQEKPIKRELEKKVETIEILYNGGNCCLGWPSWIQKEDYYSKNPTTKRNFHIEPADSTVELPQRDINKFNILLTGQFYKEEFQPFILKIVGQDNLPDSNAVAKVFRYTKAEAVSKTWPKEEEH